MAHCFLSWVSYYSLKKTVLSSLCNFSLSGHENLLLGFHYIYNMLLSSFFLVDGGVVNAGLLQPVGVEFFMLGEIFVSLRGLDKNSPDSPFWGCFFEKVLLEMIPLIFHFKSTL